MIGTVLQQKDSIAAVAVTLFKVNGYAKVSVNDICRTCEVSRSAFYSLFQSKKDVLDYIMAQPREDLRGAFPVFLALPNDFERIWYLCNRFVTLAMDFGPKLTGDLYIMQLQDDAGITEAVHALDEWFVSLARNCMQAGIIRSEEPAEVIAPMATSLICQLTYEWANRGGSFNLREQARSYAEIAYHVVPEYRMSEEQKKAL